MGHEIEADFVRDYHNEDVQCKNCTSFKSLAEKGFCSEAQSEVSPRDHCDFFQSKD